MKRILKSVLYSIPGAKPFIWGTKRKIDATVFHFKCYLYDYRTDKSYLNWRRTPGEYWKLSSELIFQHHKLEKGLCLPPETRRFFGLDAARETCRLLTEWQKTGGDRTAPVYLASLEVLRAYRARLDDCPPPEDIREALLDEIDSFLDGATETGALSTPIPVSITQSSAFDDLKDLCVQRRSTRNYSEQAVDFTLVEKAVSIAQLSPSACNRQPWHVHFYDAPEDIAKMLKLQNGNAGFGHTIPLLAVITSDMGSFFDSSERIEPALDGGLFLMSLILGLQAQGLSSCCLNWCVAPERDREAHRIGDIPNNEKILTFLAIGIAKEDAIVPLSARRPVTDVIRRHSRG